jgi:7-cyano-7-deazaguanine synthase
MKQRAITLLSGGLDSAVATLLARRRTNIVLALTFDYGQRAAKREIAAARAFCRFHKIPHKILSLPWLSQVSGSALTDRSLPLPRYLPADIGRNKKAEMKSAAAVWVPNRNAIFANIAAAFAETMRCDLIVAGFNAEEARTFPDNSLRFVTSLNRTFRLSTMTRPKLLCPTQKMTKTDIARMSIDLKLRPQFFWSCYEGGASMCGRCESCARILRAFKKNWCLELDAQSI